MKQNSNKITRDNISKHLIVYQLSIVNKTLEDTLSDDKWFFNWTITLEQFENFKKYSLSLIKKTFKCNKSKATEIFEWFYKGYGLRIKN